MTAPQAPGQMPTYLGMPSFPAAARTAVADSQLRANLTHATHAIRAKRAGAVAELSDWEELPHGQSKIRVSHAPEGARGRPHAGESDGTRQDTGTG